MTDQYAALGIDNDTSDTDKAEIIFSNDGVLPYCEFANSIDGSGIKYGSSVSVIDSKTLIPRSYVDTRELTYNRSQVTGLLSGGEDAT